MRNPRVMDIFEFWSRALLKNKPPPTDRFIKSGNKVANACLTRWRTASWLTAAVLQCNIEYRGLARRHARLP